jgi:sigma-B regulation protein RsbU (phosphoserine phosphatase)
VHLLQDGGVALGVLPEAQYDEISVAFRPGDVLLLYTDGVSEAVSPEGEQFGEARLEQSLRELLDRGAVEILEGIVERVVAWAGERGPQDDLTLLVMKVLD